MKRLVLILDEEHAFEYLLTEKDQTIVFKNDGSPDILNYQTKPIRSFCLPKYQIPKEYKTSIAKNSESIELTGYTT